MRCLRKLSQRIMKTFMCLMVVLSMLSVVSTAFGWDYYPTSYHWDFQNYCYLGFNQAMNFTDAPHQGTPYDSSLVGYWNMNEGSGAVAHDLSGNGNNGTIYGATRVDGKYGNALSFNSLNGDSVLLPSSSALTFGNGSLTLTAWVKITNFDNGDRITVFGGLNALSPAMCVMQDGQRLAFFQMANGASSQISSLTVPLNTWAFLAIVLDKSNNTITFYVNNQSETQALSGGVLSFTGQLNGLGTYLGLNTRLMNGIIDEARVYSRGLSAAEVTALYMQPDPVSLANYCNYKDPITNNTMLVHVNNPNVTSNNTTLVTCINFFAGNKLVFQANNSATVNVWTNLGQPAFTTGVWNSQNYTTTLTLDASSMAELNWNTYNITTYADAHSGVSPSNVTVGYEGSQAFSFNASKEYGLNVFVDGVSQGQISSYTFSNVTAPHTVNVTSTKLFTITASAGGNGSITPSGSVLVGSGETQQFNFTANTGYHVSKILVDNASQAIASSYTFSNLQKNHTINVSFDINTYNITATVDAHSTITPGNITIDYGGSRQFNITADSGFVNRVFVDGEDQGHLNTYNFTNVQSNHTISVSAIFNAAPSASNVSISSNTPDKPATVTIKWSDNQGLTGGGYIFCTNNTGQWVNATWTAFTSSPDWGNITLTLNSTDGTVVGFREYANNSLGVWGDSGLYSITVSATAPINLSTPTPSQSPSPSQTQQPTSTPTTETNKFPTETMLIVVAAIAIIIALLAFAFKKGYITLETVDEQENPDEDAVNEKKSKPGSSDETPDYNQRNSNQMANLMAMLKLMGETVKEGAAGSLAKPVSVCVEGVFVKDEKILLLKRNVEPFKGYWHVVGGQVKENETLKDALKREFEEETNLDITVSKIIGGRIEETFDRTKLIVAFEVTSAEGEIKLNSENTEYRWFGQVPLNSVYDYGKYLRKTV